MQFNAAVENNLHARHLCERLGFHEIGTVPGEARMKDESDQTVCLYNHEL